MKTFYIILINIFFSGCLFSSAQITTVHGPLRSGQFGEVTVLTNGNYVVTDPRWSNGTIEEVGAVYLYDGRTHNLLATLTGETAYDRIGEKGVTALSNGNYVVCSPYWDNDGVQNAGAITWGNGVTGISGIISSSNSLIGSQQYDSIGEGGITPLTNGNFVAINPYWSNDNIQHAGAITWGNGTTGITGVISSLNSLVGSHSDDFSGLFSIKELTNGNFVICSPNWDNGSISNAGAVTWVNGTTGITGTISVSNSLVGSQIGAQVGYHPGVVALTNGNYVVRSRMINGFSGGYGAVTWGNGTIGVSGVISISNSLVGTTQDSDVGSGGVFALSNGNYVVSSPSWDNGNITNVGAITWCDGSTGSVGAVSASNSLIGSQINDRVGFPGVTALSNGNFVVSSTFWRNGNIMNAGAVTWGNGTASISGVVSTSNSLVGSQTDDGVGHSGTIALPNGKYIVISPNWDNGNVANVGAVTWCDGTNAISDIVSSSNSLVGSQQNDQIGSSGAIVLTNGNYVVSSPNWDNGDIVDAGAVTWANGTTGISGTVSLENSLVGSTASDRIGHVGLTALTNGNYVICSRFWDNNSIVDAGAVTWANGTTALSGVISSSNSLLGSTQGDMVGASFAFANGKYVVLSGNWSSEDLLMNGAVTYLDGVSGTYGFINACNSIVGTHINYGSFLRAKYNSMYDYLLVGYTPGNFYVIHEGNQLAANLSSSTATVSDLPVIFSDNCNPIASLKSTGPSPVQGNVTTKVYVKPTTIYGSKPYVRRHFDITPETNTNSATGTITLYLSQADFDDFNANRGEHPALPQHPDDIVNKGNLRITQHHGNSRSGQLGSYSGWSGSGPSQILIDPADEDIFWNTLERRWEVSFAVNGFSGFFIHTTTDETPLPVTLIQFTAKEIEQQAVLTWKTTNESNAAHFEIQRSINLNPFITIGTVVAKGSSSGLHTYSFNDIEFSSLNDQIFYRLRLVDRDDSFEYSKMVSLVSKNSISESIIFPNPVKPASSITLRSNGEAGNISIYNTQGDKVEFNKTYQTKNLTHISFQGLSPGIYIIMYTDLAGIHNRKLLVEK